MVKGHSTRRKRSSPPAFTPPPKKRQKTSLIQSEMPKASPKNNSPKREEDESPATTNSLTPSETKSLSPYSLGPITPLKDTSNHQPSHSKTISNTQMNKTSLKKTTKPNTFSLLPTSKNYLSFTEKINAVQERKHNTSVVSNELKPTIYNLPSSGGSALLQNIERTSVEEDLQFDNKEIQSECVENESSFISNNKTSVLVIFAVLTILIVYSQRNEIFKWIFSNFNNSEEVQSKFTVANSQYLKLKMDFDVLELKNKKMLTELEKNKQTFQEELDVVRYENGELKVELGNLGLRFRQCKQEVKNRLNENEKCSRSRKIAVQEMNEVNIKLNDCLGKSEQLN